VTAPPSTIRRAAACLGAVGLLGLTGCPSDEVPRFVSAEVLGGVAVPAATLNRGAAAYLRSCRPCHGALGDGQGPQAVGMTPPPRDLRLGVIAFASVPAGSLWRDEDVVRIVRAGLAGTGMRAWRDISDDDLAAIVQFVKTLSPRFREERPGEPVAVSPDPWTGREGDGAARGRVVYHGLGRCQACHPAYAPPAEIQAYARDAGVEVEPRADPGQALEVRSDFGRPLLATDFRAGPLRAVRVASRTGDLYRSIAAGLGGTAMPTWKGALPEGDLWALVHYVDALSREDDAAPRR
jgi:mono/diheme cytochrome c family protein